MINTSIEKITPRLASKWLMANTKNRHMSNDRVNDIVRDIEAGRWQVNGDAIRFDKAGNMIDGQHRLKAIVKSGKTVSSLVVTGLHGDAMATIDSGRKRTISNRLHMLGTINPNTVASTLAMLNNASIGSWRNRLTPQEALDAYARHPLVEESVRTCFKSFRGLSTVLSAVHYIGTVTGHVQEAEDFVNVFKTGVPAWEGCPAHNARERIITAQAMKNADIKMDRRAMARLVFSAWNHFVKGESVKEIHVDAVLNLENWTQETFLTNYDRMGRKGLASVA